MKVVNTSSLEYSFVNKKRKVKSPLRKNLEKLNPGQSLIIEKKDSHNWKNPKATIYSNLFNHRKFTGETGLKYKIRSLDDGNFAISCTKK